jgi:hypothetical protein
MAPSSFFSASCRSAALGLLLALNLHAAPRPYYQESSWQPRTLLPAADALRGDFWPASPKVVVDYNDPGFDEARLSAVPAPGIHPRVLVSPSDVELIRAKLAAGEKAPPQFRALWERTRKGRGAFYALVTNNDTLGRELAAQLVGKLKGLQPKLDLIERQPDRDSLWNVERSIIASGDPSPPTEIWALLDYDYLHRWMSPGERELARKTIARITAGRISNFMSVPDHYMINNHQGFGMEFLRLMLLIEGEEGFDTRVWSLAARKSRSMLDWFLDKDGMCYESIKGWLNTSAFVAVGRRERDLLKHSHLRAKMRYFQAAVRWEENRWKIRDEMRASAFHVIWMMRYFHPRDRGLDFLHEASISSHPFLTDSTVKWPDPVGIAPELLLLFAGEGLTQPNGSPLDWSNQALIDQLGFPLTWQDNQRGYVDTRNSWRKDDLHLAFVCKQDFFYGGHEGSENNRLTLWSGGVNWMRDVDLLATKATFLQNMLSVDGNGQHWPPAPGVWLGVKESPDALTAAGDGRMGYSFTKSMQVHPLAFPSGKTPYLAPFTEGNFDLTRDLQIAFHPGTVRHTDGYAHTDYGPWSGETRLVESYRPWNPMEQAYRTVHLARGEHPYVLVFDDARKDAQNHLFEWNMTLPDDVELAEARTPEVVFQNTDPSPVREDDLLLAKAGTPRDPVTGKLKPAKGDPLCLVRVLWRNARYGFPVPHLERFQGFNRLSVPAISVSPEFRILIYPHRQGDPLPVTTWNLDHSSLTVQIEKQTDLYRLGAADGGRTVFSMERNSREAIKSEAPPARPVLRVRGSTFDVNDLRTTREEGKISEYRFAHEIRVDFVRPPAPAFICFTTDGSDPTSNSPRYESTLSLREPCTLKARLVDPRWSAGPRQSEILSARFLRIPEAPGLAAAPANSVQGVLTRVYEKQTVLWNDHGFFDASRNMMPDLEREKPIETALLPTIQLPQVLPTHTFTAQAKGFYRFNAWYLASESGVHRFTVNSCGPVTLDVGGQCAIESIGVFHQQQDRRCGEVLLGKGWHALELVVCDPLFWNQVTLDGMPLSVGVSVNSASENLISRSSLRSVSDGSLPQSKDRAPAPPRDHSPTPAWLEPGVKLSIYDREGLLRNPDYLDIDGLKPMRSSAVSLIEANLKPGLVRAYEGWFLAPVDGVYRFDLPARRFENASLGELRAAYQSQLRLGESVLVQRGVHGRLSLNQVSLRKGWHPLSLRMGASAAGATVSYPDGQTVDLTADLLSRPVLVDIRPKGGRRPADRYEIFAPSPMVLSLPAGREAELRYTLEDRAPTATDALYTQPFVVNRSGVVQATAFVDGQPVTPPNRVEIALVKLPEAGLLGAASFSNWTGATGSLDFKAGFDVWVAPGSSPMADGAIRALSVNRQSSMPGGPGAVDANLTRGAGRIGFKVTGLRMKENALTVGLWFSSDTANGALFGKSGYNAFGKSYKTVDCSLLLGRVRAGAGGTPGGSAKRGTWQHVVLTADENETVAYLNGERVASAPGLPSLTTDALDFLTDHPASVLSLRIYNRVLTPEEVGQWFQVEDREAFLGLRRP